MRPIDAVLERLDGANENDSGWRALCPVHDDRAPSLSIKEADDGRVLLNCFAGCDTESIVEALDLTMSDLFERRDDHKKINDKLTAIYEVKDACGELQAEHVRYDRPRGGKDCLWRTPGGTFKEGLKGRKLSSLPLYRSQCVKEWPLDVPVVVVEGEKAADALAKVYPAVLGTVTGASATPGLEALEVLRHRRIVLWSDNDQEGRRHMSRIAERLAGVASEVRLFEWKEAPPKGDAADHPAVTSENPKAIAELLDAMAATPVLEFEPYGAVEKNGGPETFTAADLMAVELPEIRWAVPDMLPEGVTLLAGKPKLGKSWLAFGLAIATAAGGVALGTKPVAEGEALYLALEDNRRRLQKRLRKLLADDAPPKGLHIATEWPRLDEGGVEALGRWLEDHPGARLVVVDILKKVRPRASGNRNVYDADYEALESLHPLTAEHGVAILVVHHLRKLGADDPMDEISGSTGLSGGVDGVLLLKRDRGRADAFLHVDGRDIEEPAELALNWDANTACWTLAGDAEEYRLSKERAEVVKTLEEADGPMTPTEVADVLGKSAGSVKKLLWIMSKDGQLSASDGHYSPTSGNRGNPGNPGAGTGNRRVTPDTEVTDYADEDEDREEVFF